MRDIADMGDDLKYDIDWHLTNPDSWGFQSPGVIAPSHMSNGTPTTPDTGLNGLPDGYEKKPASVVLDNFAGTTYVQAYNDFAGVDQDVAPGIPQGWHNVSAGIQDAAQALLSDLQNARTGPDPWKGATADAVYQNITSSLPILATISAIAQALGTLSQAFHQTMWTTKNDIDANYGNYYLDLFNHGSNPEQRDQIEQQYNSYARAVLNSAYLPNILEIANNNPNFNIAPPPHVGSTNGAPNGSSSPQVTSTPGGGGASGGGAGGAPAIGGDISSTNAGSGAQPAQDAAQLAAQMNPLPAQSAATQNPMTPAAASSPASSLASNPLSSELPYMAEGLSSLPQQLGSMLGQARGGQGTNPASGLGAAKSPLGEGKLANSLKGAGGGAGPRGVPLSKSAGAPATAAGNMAGRTMAAGSRAGLSSGPGAAGMGAAGAPGAGQHGAGAQGGPHQPSKALRRKKNGELLFGDAEAVVPVLGGEPARAEAASAAKPDAT